MKIYLAGPINGRSDSDCNDWRAEAKKHWPGETLDPMSRDYRGRELEPGIAEVIVAGDMEDIENCNALLAYVDKPSIGTSMEVFYAKHVLKMPVVVVHPGERPSPWLIEHCDSLCKSINEGVTEMLVHLQANAQ